MRTPLVGGILFFANCHSLLFRAAVRSPSRLFSGTTRTAMSGAADIPAVVQSVQGLLQDQAQEKSKSWWENYVKGSSFRGCTMGQTRKALQQAVDKHEVRNWSEDDRVQLGMRLLGTDPFVDDKLAGVLLFAEISLPAGDLDGIEKWQKACDQWKELFLAEKISDWHTTDWFCVKVLGPGAVRNGAAGAKIVLQWSHLPPASSTLWLRRAGHVAFVNHVAPSKGPAGDALLYEGFILDCVAAAETAAQVEDRFAHTGAGWVLRYCLLQEREATLAAIRRLLPTISKEGLKSSLEKSGDSKLKNQLMSAWKAAQGDRAEAPVPVPGEAAARRTTALPSSKKEGARSAEQEKAGRSGRRSSDGAAGGASGRRETKRKVREPPSSGSACEAPAEPEAEGLRPPTARRRTGTPRTPRSRN